MTRSTGSVKTVFADINCGVSETPRISQEFEAKSLLNLKVLPDIQRENMIHMWSGHSGLPRTDGVPGTRDFQCCSQDSSRQMVTLRSLSITAESGSVVCKGHVSLRRQPPFLAALILPPSDLQQVSHLPSLKMTAMK